MKPATDRPPSVRGAAAETRAAEYLARRGLTIVARNWRCKGGEIDIIAREGKVLVFVEVRARASSAFGGAAESLTAAKRARLWQAAERYLAGMRSLPPCRFDAVLIQSDRIEWLRDVFQGG